MDNEHKWKAHVLRMEVERKLEQVTHLRMLDQAAVSVQYLTQQPEWDKFLSYLQAWLEQVEQAVAGWQAQVNDPAIMGEALSVAKVGLLMEQTRLQAIKQVMEMPKELTTRGELARETLTKLNLLKEEAHATG